MEGTGNHWVPVGSVGRLFFLFFFLEGKGEMVGRDGGEIEGLR